MMAGDPDRAYKVYDALATAALEYFPEEAIVVGEAKRDDDDTHEVVLLVEGVDGRTGSVRISRDGMPKTWRPLEGLAENAARSLMHLAPPVEHAP